MTGADAAAWARGLALALAALAAVLGLGLVLRLAPDFADRLRDDAFYEFTWAANVAAGRGPAVSDGVTTSGVQLLWSLLLVPFAWLFGAGSLPALAPWFGAALHGMGAVAIWRAVPNRLAGGSAALCWLGNPLLLRECQNGQETALAALLLLLLWLARGAGGGRFGALAVLTSFARSDLLAVVAALSLTRHGRRWWRGLPLPAGILVLHLLSNAALGGGLLPDSAGPMAWLWHANFAATDPSLVELFARQWWFTRPVLLGNPWATASAFGSGLAVFLLVRPWWPRRLRLVPPLVVGAAALLGVGDLLVPGVAAFLLLLLPGARRRRPPRALLALFLGLLVLVAVHYAVRWYPRDYYLAPLVVLAVAALLRLRRSPWLLAAFAAAQLAGLPFAADEPLAPQAAMALAGEQLHQVVPAGERVGCFNSGLVTFAADVLQQGRETRRAVVNLDGVVDARSFAALRAGRLREWLDEQGIRYVVDDAAWFATDPRQPHANGQWFASGFDPARDLAEVARFVVAGGGPGGSGLDRLRLYRLVGRGEPPAVPGAARDLGPWRGARPGRCVLWPARAGERLEWEPGADGRQTLVAVDRDTVVVLAVPWQGRRDCPLFVSGFERPVLTLHFD